MLSEIKPRNPASREAVRAFVVRQISLGRFADELETLENDIAYYMGKMRVICADADGTALGETPFAEMTRFYRLHSRATGRAEELRSAIDEAV